jgi:predicted ribosome quality control (RQC) complex YloA/Tae2 family protein
MDKDIYLFPSFVYMREIANLELFCLVKELQFLIGSRLVKIYELAENEFRLKFYKPGKGEFNLIFELKKRINLTKYIKEAPARPTNFIMGLRKHLENSELVSIMQYELDRVLALEFQKEKKFILILEMFSHGNLILTDEKFTILQAYRSEQWKDRKIKIREKYNFPISIRIAPFELNEKKLKGVLDDKKLIVCLSEKINLGVTYLEEICLKAKIDPSKRADSLSDNELNELFAAFIEVIEQVNKLNPTIYIKDERYFDYSPFLLQKHESLKRISFKSFSDTLDEFYHNVDDKPVKKVENKTLFKLSTQEKHLSELLAKANESKEIADSIYKNYEKIELTLKLIKNKIRENKSIEEIKNELKKEIPEEATLIESIDKREGKVIINL